MSVLDERIGGIDAAIALGQALVRNLEQVVLGSERALEAAATAALAGGHLLIEDVPGVGKTVLARALATSLGAELSRVQGHPDLLPSDITGVSVFMPDTGSWDFRPGPVFAHVVLVDELNRTPPRTQSALLETMEERQVSVDGESWPLPQPHMVIATQNPRSQRGTFPLVESQLDRFAIATPIGYPDAEQEAQLALHAGGTYALADLRAGLHAGGLDAGPAGDRVGVSAAVDRGVRGGDLPGHEDGAGSASRCQPPCRHLAHPIRPGARRPLVEELRGARRREGGCRRVPGSSPAHGRGRRGLRAIGRSDPGAPSRRRHRRGREPLGTTGPSGGADGRGGDDHRAVVAGRAQRRRRVGAAPRRPRLRDAPASGSSDRGLSSPAPGSKSAPLPPMPLPDCRWTSSSSPAPVLRVRAIEPPGPEIFVGPVGRKRSVGDRITLIPVRRGVHDRRDGRHRLGGSVRAAVVDPSGAAPAAGRAPCLASLRTTGPTAREPS